MKERIQLVDEQAEDWKDLEMGVEERQYKASRGRKGG